MVMYKRGHPGEVSKNTWPNAGGIRVLLADFPPVVFGWLISGTSGAEVNFWRHLSHYCHMTDLFLCPLHARFTNSAISSLVEVLTEHFFWAMNYRMSNSIHNNTDNVTGDLIGLHNGRSRHFLLLI